MTMFRTLSYLGGFVAICGVVMLAMNALAGAARAQSRDPQQDRRLASFQAADTNRDGRISRDEFEAFARARIAASGGMRAAMFGRMDPDQQKARLEERFFQMDDDHKGYLTPADWQPQS